MYIILIFYLFFKYISSSVFALTIKRLCINRLIEYENVYIPVKTTTTLGIDSLEAPRLLFDVNARVPPYFFRYCILLYILHT